MIKQNGRLIDQTNFSSTGNMTFAVETLGVSFSLDNYGMQPKVTNLIDLIYVWKAKMSTWSRMIEFVSLDILSNR